MLHYSQWGMKQVNKDKDRLIHKNKNKQFTEHHFLQNVTQ